METPSGQVLVNPDEAWREVTLPSQSMIQELAASELLDAWFQRRLLEELTKSVVQEPCGDDVLIAFANRQGLPSLEALDIWAKHRGLTLLQLEKMATFSSSVTKATESIWSSQVPSLFLERRERYDAVTLSMVRVRDADMAMELFFQLQEQSIDFTEAVRLYGEDVDRRTRGVVGPMPVQKLHPVMAQVVRRHPPGSLFPPLDINGMQHIVRVESFEPAQLSESIRQQLLTELRSRWLGEQLGQLRQRLNQLGEADSPFPFVAPTSETKEAA